MPKKNAIAEKMRNVLLKINTDHLRLLADWLDREQENGRWGGIDGSYEVQKDLRRWAKSIDDVLD